ncbi:glyoxalase [Streptomyces sp. CB01635]|uniref:VOC family protein n=1 Tax=unclassified Streptomyces TaxID=2593676 RepID=UPI000C27013E|nr:VOC family protein [Streptomyces sp. CB01635]PJN08783.1 glyoxalase [Streptomyces sp. CB01635]
MLRALDHVQLAAPAGSEDALRRFYGDALGMTETPKPPALVARGGCWFEAGQVRLHLGIERAPAGDGSRKCRSRPASKAHLGLRVAGIETYAARLAAHGVRITWDGDLPGHRRFYADDPVGNRLEFLEPVTPDAP